MSNKHIKLELGKFTLFTGLNGTGKTQRMDDILKSLPEDVHTNFVYSPRRHTYNIGHDHVIDALCHPAQSDSIIEKQVTAWLHELFPHISTKDGDEICKLGYGYDSAYYLLWAVLIASPGDYLFINTPELGLHEQAQVRVVNFLVKAAKAGINVVVETQSQVVFYALRVQVRDANLEPEDVMVYFFKPDDIYHMFLNKARFYR